MKTFNVNAIQLRIQSIGFDTGKELEDIIINEIEKLGKYFSRIKKCEVILKKEKDERNQGYIAEAKLFVPLNVLFAETRSTNFTLATKRMFDDLNDQLLRYKEKLTEKITR